MIALLAIRSVLGAAWGFISKLPLTTIAIALLGLSLAYCWHGWHLDHIGRQLCATGRAQDRASYYAAQAQAVHMATIVKDATEAKQETARKAANDTLHTAMGDADSRLARYISLHHAAAPSSTRSTDLSGPTQTAAVVDGPVTPAELVTVTTEDLTICNENSVRLQNVKTWAESLK